MRFRLMAKAIYLLRKCDIISLCEIAIFAYGERYVHSVNVRKEPKKDEKGQKSGYSGCGTGNENASDIPRRSEGNAPDS